MTLKQFIYLATGAAIAYFLFVFLSPVYPIVAWPGILISASLGAAFAFLPIHSRPLDSWLGAFLKAVYSPTKRVWKKNNKVFKDDPLFNSRLSLYLAGLQPRSEQPIHGSTDMLISSSPLTSDLPTATELGKTVDLARQAQNLQLKIIQTERTLSQIKSQSLKPAVIPVDYTAAVNKIITDLQTLVTQASQVKQQLNAVTEPERAKVEAISPARLKEKIKIVVPPKSKSTEVALTTFPNILSGITRDQAGNYLEGVIAVIYDKAGLPVRALKSNKLGQFTGSTPLPNGTYTLELEKDNFTFDVLQIELSGEVLPPLLITAK